MGAPLSMGNGAGVGSAPRLGFAIEDGGALDPAAVPTLRFAVRVDSGGAAVRSLALQVQLRIAATRRSYDEGDELRLAELFGRPEQWGKTLRSLHWTNVPLQVPAFSGSKVVELDVPCTYDLEVTATRYLHALRDGEIPLEFLFSGSVFYAGPGGGLQVQPISWSAEADYRLPVAAWREMMDIHFPDSAWLRLRRRSLERLHAYRGRRALLSWEDTIDDLLEGRE
jgi:hypothetical protein